MSTGPVDRRGVVFLLALLFGPGCGREPDVRVDLSRRGESRPTPTTSKLRLAIGPMVTPGETIRDYKKLADYIAHRTGTTIEIVQRRSYAETNSLLERGAVDFGFVCTGAFAAMKPDAVEILAVPVVAGKASYASYIIVHQDDPAKDLRALRGSAFAFVDPLSLTGRIYPEWAARQVVGNDGPLFSKTFYTHSHSQSVDLVAAGRVRAAAVDSLIFDQIGRSDPPRIRSVRILSKSEDFGVPPFVAGAKLSVPLRQRLRRALLQAHFWMDGREALGALGFERFTLADTENYDPVRRMHKAVIRTHSEPVP